MGWPQLSRPILGEPAGAKGARARAQIGQLLPVREDAVTGVVGQEMAAALELIVRPADPLSARGQMAGGGAPADPGQPLALVFDPIPEVFAHEGGLAQAVLLGDPFVPSGQFVLADEADREMIQDLLFFGLGPSNRLRQAGKVSNRGKFVHFIRR